MKTPPLIQIAEDEPDMAQLMALQLQRQGYRTLITSDGLEAINTVLQQRPQLLVLDWMLPQLNGIEICRMVKASARQQQIPILMVTAMASVEHRLRGFQHGADDYLPKPFDPRELVARVKRLLQVAQAAAA